MLLADAPLFVVSLYSLGPPLHSLNLHFFYFTMKA